MLMRVGAVVLAAGLILVTISFIPALAGDEQAAAAPTPPAAPTPASPEPDISTQGALEGRALFRAKGCMTCHYHAAVSNEQWFGGDAGGPPNLTHYQPDPAFVREWLRDPSAIRPGTAMPTLGLTEDEITALIAFLQEQ